MRHELKSLREERIALGLLACAGVLFGCQELEQEPGSSGGAGWGAEEITDSKAEAVTTCGLSNLTHFSYTGTSPGGLPMDLKPSDTHFCWLSEMVGNGFHSGWAMVTGGVRFSLDSRAATPSAAYCVPRSCFYSNNPGSVVWVSDQTEDMLDSGGFGYHERLMWWGDAASILQGIFAGANGMFRPTTFASVFQHSSPFNHSILQWGNAQPNSTMGVRGSSVFVGVPGGAHTPVFPAGRSLTKNNGCVEEGLMSVDQGICFLTQMKGDFWGAWESVRISTRWNSSLGKDEWALRVCAGGTPTITGRAACYAYNQTH